MEVLRGYPGRRAGQRPELLDRCRDRAPNRVVEEDRDEGPDAFGQMSVS
jgi:hypothetical protein